MSYPELPKNRMIVDGVDLTERFAMILSDGYTLEPPEPKTYEVDIPGGDGKIDLTESLLGDTAYKNRNMEFSFYVIDIENFEQVKTEVSNFLHGKAFNFQITMDPGYTYHGRFSVSAYEHSSYNLGIVGVIKIKIDGNPFKYQEDRVYKVDAIGGKTVYLESGRKRVRPTIETNGFLKVIHNGKLVTLPKGSWAINDILFKDGINELYLNSYDIRNVTWGDLKTNNITWGDMKAKRLYELYCSDGQGSYVFETWSDQLERTWSDISEKTWSEFLYRSEVTKDIDDIYIKYKVGDL